MKLRVVPPLAMPAPETGPAPQEARWRAPLPTLDTLVRTYSPYVARIAMRLLGRDDEVDDVIQDVFLAAVRGVGDVAEPDAIKGWLATVTVRAVRRRLRIRSLSRFIGLDRAPGYESVASTDASPEQCAIVARVFTILDRLPANHRIAWSLRTMEGYGLDAVAEACGCSLATAKRYVAAAQTVIEGTMSDE